MTREEMALTVDEAIEDEASTVIYPGDEEIIDRLTIVAAELRKTCATCVCFRVEHFVKVGGCEAWRDGVPKDGSGFCHRYEGKHAL